MKTLLLAVLTASISVISYYAVQNERAAIRVQDQAAATMRDLPKTLTHALHVEGDATRTLLSRQLGGLRGDIFRRVRSIQADAVGQIGNAIAVANVAEYDANARLTDALNQTQKLADLADQISATAKPITHIAQQVDTALPDFLDCAVTADGFGNPECLFRRYADITADTDRAVQTIATAMPQFAKSADAVTANAVGMSASWAKISEVLEAWVQRLTAPLTVKQEISAWIKTLIIALSHAL